MDEFIDCEDGIDCSSQHLGVTLAHASGSPGFDPSAQRRSLFRVTQQQREQLLVRLGSEILAQHRSVILSIPSTPPGQRQGNASLFNKWASKRDTYSRVRRSRKSRRTKMTL